MTSVNTQNLRILAKHTNHQASEQAVLSSMQNSAKKRIQLINPGEIQTSKITIQRFVTLLDAGMASKHVTGWWRVHKTFFSISRSQHQKVFMNSPEQLRH